MAGERPFAGDYPTRDEIITALGEEFGAYADEVVAPPMGDSEPGPLADKLTECKSSHLTMGWPVVFRAGVRKMLTDAGVELPEAPKG